ncbi:hypothetical protein B0H14DRAFT_3145424 [Mycena olivaceomarginata]|nr:hypothetical protein B0H14DRAFT_3145424 [Mycena olivaceomarginata]
MSSFPPVATPYFLLAPVFVLPQTQTWDLAVKNLVLLEATKHQLCPIDTNFVRGVFIPGRSARSKTTESLRWGEEGVRFRVLPAHPRSRSMARFCSGSPTGLIYEVQRIGSALHIIVFR